MVSLSSACLQLQKEELRPQELMSTTKERELPYMIPFSVKIGALYNAPREEPTGRIYVDYIRREPAYGYCHSKGF